jgi:rhodanese-related sulfurtransferase
VTNGHVVEPYYASNEQQLRVTALRQAVEQACVSGGSSQARKRHEVESLLPRITPSASVEVRKSLTVVLPNRETYVAEVKAYSPPLAERPGKEGGSGSGPATESGKDVAIVKIDARNLPTLPLGNSDRVQLGQPLHLLGFPGVVLYHDLLDKRSAVEASVTSGRISSIKLDARGAPVIQTDAAASWGNSGGPAINEQGEVVGILTFISLTSDETQAIQGFNFLVPANIVREFARTAGADPKAPSPFNAVWHDAVARYARGDWAGAQAKLDAAARLVPNLPDVQRLQAEVQLRLLQASRWPSPAVLGGIAVAALAAAGTLCWGVRRRRMRRPTTRVAPRAPEPETASPVVRVSAEDLARALAQRTDLVIVDVRDVSSYEKSSVQAKGAIRANVADIIHAVSTLAREQGIVIYCDSPGEVTSMDGARRLVTEGYTRVVVLAGGFAAWETASLPLERTPHARTLTAEQRPALPAPAGGNGLQVKADVDLPVGVKGAGPYYNGRATRLGLTGLTLRSPEMLAVGQKLRLTIFLSGESMEVGGQVVSSNSASADGRTYSAEVAFEALGQEQTTALEGFILAQRTAGRR